MADVGQGVFIKLDFADGGKCEYARTFLIINKIDNKLHLINVSSIKGKEWKLGFNSNKQMNNSNPPFLKKSFAKLDALYIVPDSEFIDQKILCNKRRIHPIELKDIINHHNKFREKNKINIKEYLFEDIKQMNSELVLI